MNRLFSIGLRKYGFGKIPAALAFAVSVMMIVSCGGGGGGSNNSSSEPPPPTLRMTINSIELDECPDVKVYLSVTDEDNQLVEDNPDLSVTLYEDGAEQTTNFSLQWLGDTQMPKSIVFAMDYSLSMSDSYAEMEDAVKGFVNAMSADDQAAIIKFYYEPQVMIPLTSDKAALRAAVDQPPASDQYTNIYDTVVEAATIAAGGEGRVAVVLLTDGEHLVIDQYPVYHTLQEALDHAIQLEVPIFSIALGLREENDIRYISEETGGIYYPIFQDSVIDNVIMTLHDLFDKEHLVIYTSGAQDGSSHSLQLAAELDGVTGSSAIRNFTLCPAP